MRSKGTHGTGLSPTQDGYSRTGQRPQAAGYYGSASDERELGYREWRDTRAKASWPLWMTRARYINYCRSWRAHRGT